MAKNIYNTCNISSCSSFKFRMSSYIDLIQNINICCFIWNVGSKNIYINKATILKSNIHDIIHDTYITYGILEYRNYFYLPLLWLLSCLLFHRQDTNSAIDLHKEMAYAMIFYQIATIFGNLDIQLVYAISHHL